MVTSHRTCTSGTILTFLFKFGLPSGRNYQNYHLSKIKTIELGVPSTLEVFDQNVVISKVSTKPIKSITSVTRSMEITLKIVKVGVNVNNEFMLRMSLKLNHYLYTFMQ